MQPFAPSATTMFSSWRRGAEASTPPAQDAFREVFANHLLARMDTKAASGGTGRSLSRLGTARGANRSLSRTSNSRADIRRKDSPARSQTKQENSPQAAPSTEDSRQTAAAARERRHQEVRKSHHKPASQTPTAGLAPEQNQATSQTSQSQAGASAAAPPQALQDLIAFLQSFPGGSLTISPDKAPAVASYLESAGLPQAEIDRLLTPASNQEISLNAADLQACQQAAGQGQGAAQGAAATQPAGAANQAATQPQEAQEIQQTPGYREAWEKLTLPQNMVPTVRLALARLGASPQALAQLDDKGQGQGIPLTGVWQVLQGIKDGLNAGSASEQTGAIAAAEASQAAVLGQQKVSGAEMEDWRQVLLKAGLPSEVVEKVLGQKSVGSQEQLKDTLLAAAPEEQPAPTLSVPKPLYRPQDLQMRTFYWQSNLGGDQPQLNGDGSGPNGQGPTAQPAAPAPAPGENFAHSAFGAEFQGVTQGASGGAAPLSATGSTWRLLPPEVRESLWTQLQAGITTDLGQGENKVTLNLNPPELGQIQLTLNLKGQDLSVTAVATRPEAAELASLGMPQLVQALAQQGLVLNDFQVRLQPDRPIAPVLAGTRDKSNGPGKESSTSSRRRSGGVDRFV
jgi:flagellar hook-length control protein FliK